MFQNYCVVFRELFCCACRCGPPYFRNDYRGIYILHIQANEGGMKLTSKLSTSLEPTHTTLKTQDFQCFTLVLRS